MSPALELLLEANKEATFVSVVDEAHIEAFLNSEGVIKEVWYQGVEPIGLYLAKVCLDWCEPVKKLYEFVVYIKPAYRKSWLAGDIAKKAEAIIKASGVEEVVAGVSLDINKAHAQKFYLKRGFLEYGNSFKRKV